MGATERHTLDLSAFVGTDAAPVRIGPDPVNAPMVRHYCDAIGDENPIHVDADFAASTEHGGLVAPPAMLQAWTMPPRRAVAADAPQSTLGRLFGLLEREEGLDCIVATDCVQEYDRYLRPGDRVVAHEIIESISEPKDTALGRGRFINTLITYTDHNGERVATQRFRLLRFRAKARSASAREPGGDAGGSVQAPPLRPRPLIGRDNAFFWEGVERGELLIQRCCACGRLRHPPRPMCPGCRSLEWDTVRACGAASVHSFVVSHHPAFPGFEYPLITVVGQLAEGTRYVANLLDVDATDVHIGMAVRVEIREVEKGLRLPVFVPVVA
jgi:uncharacterized OB-fold protein